MLIAKSDLLPALEICAAIVKGRTTLAVLHCVRLEAVNNTLTIRASDLDSEQIQEVECVGDLLATCVSAKVLLGLIHAANGEISISKDAADAPLSIKGEGEARLSCFPADEFPFTMEDKFTAIGLNCADLADGIEAVEFAQYSGDNPDRYHWQSVHVITSPTQIMCEAYGRAFAAQFKRASIASTSDFCVLTPFVKQFCEALRQDAAVLSVGENKLRVSHMMGSYTCKKPEGTFPPVEKLFNSTKGNAIGKAIPEHLITPLTICAQLTQADTNGAFASIHAEFNQDGCKVALNGNNPHQYTRLVEGRFESCDMVLGLNTALKCLKAFKDDEVTLMTCDCELKPALLIEGKELTALTSQML